MAVLAAPVVEQVAELLAQGEGAASTPLMILPHLQRVSLRVMAKATGLSVRQLRDLLAERAMPRPRTQAQQITRIVEVQPALGHDPTAMEHPDGIRHAGTLGMLDVPQAELLLGTQ
ncbi:MAG: hypothetical protein M3Q71_00470 [Chloroflexota bacterium]|nr:hypothetical protein [Chloroflexota bacterium]